MNSIIQLISIYDRVNGWPTVINSNWYNYGVIMPLNEFSTHRKFSSALVNCR